MKKTIIWFLAGILAVSYISAQDADAQDADAQNVRAQDANTQNAAPQNPRTQTRTQDAAPQQNPPRTQNTNAQNTNAQNARAQDANTQDARKPDLRALDMEVWGELKTGFYSEKRLFNGETYELNTMHNNDGDSGNNEGRIRFGMGINQDQGLFGLRMQFFRDDFKRRADVTDIKESRIQADYAYAYANLFDKQFKVSAGLLGESPWSTGGPELWKELERADVGPIMGIRLEFKPQFLFLNGLNLGVVLNHDNDALPSDAVETFGDILGETILGISYEHDWFAFRFAYRLNRALESPAGVIYGPLLLYRAEERALRKFLPGLSISDNGFCQGINAVEGGQGGTPPSYIANWFYICYDPDNFTTGIDVRYEHWFLKKEKFLEFRPYFYYKFFGNLLVIGLRGGLEMGFDAGKYFNDEDNESFYNYWYLEPKVQFNIASTAYIALFYRYTNGAFKSLTDRQLNKDQETHWFDLRVCFKL